MHISVALVVMPVHAPRTISITASALTLLMIMVVKDIILPQLRFIVNTQSTVEMQLCSTLPDDVLFQFGSQEHHPL
jgi:hypothetical protein